MKLYFLFFFLFLLNGNNKDIPKDLENMNVTSFFAPDEILRIWRSIEGGVPYGDMIEFVRFRDKWSVFYYRYILDQIVNKQNYQNLKFKKDITPKNLNFLSFVNYRLLYKDVNNLNNKECLCDIYIAEYRKDNSGNTFQFNLKEENNTNASKICLIKFLEQFFEDRP